MPMPITVQCYAGYRGDERPLSFRWQERSLQVEEVLDRWYDPDADYFKVVADDGSTYLLRHNLEADDWELIS